MRKILLTLLIASFAGVMCSCEEDEKEITNAGAVAVGAGSVDSLTTPNTARVNVWFRQQDYSQIQTAGILFGQTKDLDFLVTYGEDINVEFKNQDVCVFDLIELQPNSDYYYVGYAKLTSGVVSYSGIRYIKTLKDEISITPGLVTFDPIDLANPTATSLTSNIVVKTQFADWTPEIDAETYPWIKSATRLDDTTMQVVVSTITEQKAALEGRSGQVRIIATTNENATKMRSVLINQLPATTEMGNPADHVYTPKAMPNPVTGVAKSNVGFDLEACEAPEWITIMVGTSGSVSLECQANTSVDYREGTVKLVTAMSGEENIVNIKQDPAMLVDVETLELGYQNGSEGTFIVSTYTGTPKMSNDTRNNAGEVFANGNPNQKFRITTPATGGIKIQALTTNQCLEDQSYPLTIYFVDGENTYTKDVTVVQKATTFTIDVDNFEFPKSIAEYYVTTSLSGAVAEPQVDWIEATVDGTTVTIKTKSEANTVREGIVNIVWGEHVCPVTVKQLTANDGVAENAVANLSINLPYGETMPVAVDFAEVLEKFGLTSTAMDAYYVTSTSTSKGKFKEGSKSIIWRALLADGNPYLSERGLNIYTGEGYGSWYDAAGNANAATEGVIALNFDESTGAINVSNAEAAEVGKTYTGQLELAYNQPAEGKVNTYTVKVSVTITTALLKEVTLSGAAGAELWNNNTIDSLMGYAFSIEEDLIAGKIQSGEIEMVGLNPDGTEVANKTYGTTGFIFAADGTVGTYPNPVYVEYKNSRIYAGVIDGVAATIPSGTYGIKFKYNGIELPVYIK